MVVFMCWGPLPSVPGEDQETSFDITATPWVITNYPLQIPPGSTGIVGKVHDVRPRFVFVNRGEVQKTDELESDLAFAATLDSGEFAPEYAWWLVQWHAFLSGPFLKGRDWSLVPRGVVKGEACEASQGRELSHHGSRFIVVTFFVVAVIH